MLKEQQRRKKPPPKVVLVAVVLVVMPVVVAANTTTTPRAAVAESPTSTKTTSSAVWQRTSASVPGGDEMGHHDPPKWMAWRWVAGGTWTLDLGPCATAATASGTLFEDGWMDGCTFIHIIPGR